jgi:AcrR family transcriptional regulator
MGGTTSIGANPDTADRILAATAAAMQDHGIIRLSLEDVARRAGLSRQTLYRYFPSKQALLDATVLAEEQEFLRRIMDAATAEATFDGALRAAIAVCLRTGREHALLNRLLKTEPESILPLLTTESGPVLNAARAALDHVLRGYFPDAAEEPLRWAADSIARTLVSYVINPPPAIDEVVAERLTDLLGPGLMNTLSPGTRSKRRSGGGKK